MIADATYGSSPIRRSRRSKDDIAAVRRAILKVTRSYTRMTVRQVYYQLVTLGVIEKTEAEYKGTVCRLLAELRRDGTLPYHKIADNTRWMRKPDTYSGLEEMLSLTHQTYRRAIWDTLCEICDACITRHIDQEAYYSMQVVEDAERDTLARMIESMGGAA